MSDHTTRPDFSVLGFMTSLKAARDFGLDADAANAIALRFDPRSGDKESIVDALTAALVERSGLDVPGWA